MEQLNDTDNMNSCLTDIHISTTVPGIERKENLSPQQQKALTQEMLDKEYNTTQWTHVYTDGSAEQAIKQWWLWNTYTTPNRGRYIQISAYWKALHQLQS